MSVTDSDSDGPGTDEAVTDRFDHVEDLLLGGPRSFSLNEVARELDIDIEEAENVWRAFGFPHDGRDEKIFTADDLVAMGVATAAYSFLPLGRSLASARATGQAMARLAEWQAQRLDEFEKSPHVEDDLARITVAMGQIQDLIWRRHLAAALRGLDTGRLADAGGGDGQELVVGFCDIVGYTALSRKIGMDELAVLLEIFDEHANNIITARGGQVIKSLGDAVMFTVADPLDATEIGLQLHTLTEWDRIPQLRVGLALGRVLSRFGDVFGEPVNIAARLTSSARAGTSLCDEALADAVDDGRISFRPISALSVRGYRRLKARVIAYS